MYKPFSQFIFRTPFSSYDNYKTTIVDQDSLMQKLSDSQVQEAIFIASPILYKELQKLLHGEIKDKKEIERITDSVVRYISRMSTRCTPFGLFAGCGIGETGDVTGICLDDIIDRTTRLDMYYLCTLYDALIKKEEIKNRIKYYPNSSLYSFGRKLRYIETLYRQNRRQYQVAEVEQSGYLNLIIKQSGKGAGIYELAQLLVKDDITIEGATDYINELIDAQILVGELSQSVTGADFLTRVVEMLKRIGYTGGELPLLVDINNLLKQLDSNNSGNNLETYRLISEKIKEINIPFEERYLLQVDMLRPAKKATLGLEIIEELEKTMNFLNKITPSGRNETLSKFQEDFYNRYEEKEVPLMEALDPELGIGYPSRSSHGDISPLVDDFFLPQRQGQTAVISNGFTSMLLKKTIRCLSQNDKEIVIHDDDIKGFNLNWDDLPLTMSTMCTIIKAQKGDVLIELSSIGGSCGANLLGRFAHTDAGIKRLVEDITKKEQELIPNAIIAEIVHLPEARIGNIQSRPHIREYELLYLCESDLPTEKLIHMSDLMLSVRKGRLVIRSKKLNKEIIPRLTTAHNYRNGSMPVYRFLCEMQHANGRNGLYFNWGYLENELKYRPRVRYSNTILSPASWTVRVDGIKHLFAIKDNDELISKASEWRTGISLPDQVLMPDGDNELYVDWKNALSIHSLFSIIKKRQHVKFNEFLFDPDNSPAIGTDGKYLNECIIAFSKN